MTELEQKRSDPPSQTPGFAEIVRTTSCAPNVVYIPTSPSSVVHIEKLEYKTNEVLRERKLLQVKRTHPGNLTIYPDIDLHVKHFFCEQLKMPNREIDDSMNVAKLP